MNERSDDFLDQLVTQCDFWRDASGAALVRAAAEHYSPTWRVNSDIFRRWIKGQAHKRGRSIADDEIEAFVRGLSSRAIADKCST
jgi:hypothetical protein